MKKLVLIILLFAVVSCKYDNHKQQYFFAKFAQWDSQLPDQYLQIADSLSLIKPDELSTKNRHYHTLLTSISGAFSGRIMSEDSALNIAKNWYQSRKDFRNACRALIFNSSNLDKQYERLKEAEDLFVRHKVNDPLTEAYLYMYLSESIIRPSSGVSLSRQTALQKSEVFKRLSVSIFKNIGRLRDAQNLLINSYSRQMFISREKQLESLKEIESFDTIYPEVRSKLLINYANYYFSINDTVGFKYLRDFLNYKDNNFFEQLSEKSILLRMSEEYRLIGKMDSSLHYATLYNNHLLELPSVEFNGYRNLSLVYEAMGDIKNAYKYLQLYQRSYNYKQSSQYQDVLLQKIATEKEHAKQVKQLQRERSAALYGSALVIVLLFATVGLSLFKNRRGSIGNARAEEEYKAQIAELNELYKRSKFTNEVLKASAGLMPVFIDSMAKEAARSRKISGETFDNILNNISSLRQSGRDIISDIAKSEEFAGFFPEIASYKELSSYERVVLALFEMGYSPKEISNLISTTPASVRSIKAKIKDKLPSLSMSGEGENQAEDN
jgi:hypothetical protein